MTRSISVVRGLATAGLLAVAGLLAPAGLLAVAGLLASAAVRAEAQEPVVFMGQVVDTYLGQPVEGALVVLPETRRADGSVVTGVADASGRFHITGVPAGPSIVSVARIGYADLEQVLDIQEGQFVEVALIPKPLVLEGIEVYVDRLESRLRGVPFAANTYPEAELRFAPDMSVADYLASRPNFEFVPCFVGASGPVFARGRECIRTRGVTPQRPKIFIDDAPAFGGVPELASLPTSEVYRVEVIRGCGQIRVYTVSYAEGRASRSRPLLPIVC